MDWTSGLNIEFPIYKEDGTSFNGLVLRKATVDTVVMSLGDKITGDVYYKDNSLAFTMHEYVVYKDVKYTIVNPPTVVREGLVRDNSELKGMTKYSFEFYHPMYLLNNLPFADVAVSSDETRYLSENKTFSWIGKPDDFIAKLNKNLEGTEWVVVKSDRFPKDKANTLSQVLQFDKNTIGDAMKKAYEEWDVPYVIDSVSETEQYYGQGKRFKVVFGLPSNEIYETDVDRQAGTPFVFEMGQGVGLKNNSRTPRNNKIVTRLSGYGSERNIPYGYPQIVWTGDQSWTDTKNNPNDPTSYPLYKGIVGGRYVKLIKHPFTRTHLMPSVYRDSVNKKVNPFAQGYNPNIELVDYYDAKGDEYPNKINEASPSYEIHEFDTYPQMNDGSANISIVNAVPLDKDLNPVSDWDDSMDDEGNYIQSYFQITLPRLSFDIYACAAITEEMKVNMRSGACIGCTFDVQVDWEDYKNNFYDSNGDFAPDGTQRDTNKYPKSNEGSIVVVVKKDNTTFGTLMPNIYQNPKSGDEFVVLGISLPNEYIESAETKLDEEMKSYMLENNVYYYDYPLKFDEYFLATHTNILSQVKTNNIVHFDFSGNLLQLFVKQITIKYGNAPLPQYDITLSDNIEVVLNQIGKVADDVEHLGSLISMLRQTKQDDSYSIGLAQKLSKVDDDTARGLITFLKGLVSRGDVVVNGLLTAYNAVMNTIKSSNYTGDGVTDSGWLITNDYAGSSRLVVDYLYARKKAVFESLEVKELQFTSGDLAQSLASATIERTDYLQVDEQGDETILGYSDRKIPWTLKGFLLRLSSRKPYALARNKQIRINLKPEDLQKVNRVRCYFLAKNEEKTIFNLWKVNDLARCQTFNIDNIERETYAGETHKEGNVYWWRLVKNISTETVTVDGKDYHYFDVAYGFDAEQAANQTGIRTSWCDILSDLPAAGDKVVQFGNTDSPARMNIIVSEVNGEGNADAPSIKSYRGVHTFNTDDCWWGGESCRKMMLSPSSGVEFYAPTFKFITEYGIERTQVERGAWLAIPFEEDTEHQIFPDYSDDILDKNGNFVSRSDGSPKKFVRKCRYYDNVEHRGSSWRCTIADSYYWRWYNKGVWSKITDAQYKALKQEEKDKCEEVRNYTTDEPSKASNDWTVSAERGQDGSFKSRVFCRTNINIKNANVRGGSYDNPIPTLTKIGDDVVQITWKDGVPQGTEMLWSTVCTFYGDGSNSGWSKPSQETDTETLDIEFSTNATQPDVPVGTAANRNTQEIINARQAQGWYDPSRLPEGQQMVYRAECKIKNGVYETKDGQPAWVISKILGENGKNSVRLDIDNEMDAVQTDSTGVVTAERTVSTVVHLYDGATEVDMVTSSLTTDGNKQKSGNGIKVSWTYNVGSSISDMEKTINYVYNGVEYSAVFSIVMSKGQAIYQLKPSMSAIPFQRNADNTLTPSSQEVGLSIVKIDGGSSQEITSGWADMSLCVRYSTSSMPTSMSGGSVWRSGNVSVQNTADNLYIAMFNASGVLLDRETIPVVKDGEKGTSVREVKPYYAKQSPESYNGVPPQDGWEESIAALGGIREGWYVWTKNVISFTDNVESTTTYTVSKWGIDGDGIENIETKFYENSLLLTQRQLEGKDPVSGTTYVTESDWKEYSQLALKKGDYIYTRTKITYDKGDTPTISYQVNRLGQDGVGYVATEEYYVLGSSQTDVPTGHPYTGNQPYKKYTAAEWQQIEITGGWSESRPTYQGNDKKYLWNFEVSFDTDGNVMVTRPICIGNYAKGIVSIVETYAISAYAVAPQAGSYPSDIETWTDEAHDCAPTDEKPYQWNKTVTSYSDDTSDTFYHVSAVKGTRGRGITNTNIYYYASDTTPSTPSGDPSKTDWVDDGNNLITDANANKHLYESTCTTYSNGTYSWTEPLDDGLISDMAATSEEFALSDSSTTAPTEGWNTSVTPTAGKWLWSRTVLTFKNGKKKYVNTQCVGYCGTNGNGIVSITRTFAISNIGTTASETTEPSHQGSWTASSPVVTEEYPYLWAKEVVVFTDTTKNTTKYYCIGRRGDNGVDAQDIEWVYIRTKTNTAPTILNDDTYTDTNGKTYTSDDHLPQVSGNTNIENNQNRYQCTDDPKGVTDVWLYEWEIKRTKGAASNGHRSWDYYQGTMTLHNNFAQSAFIIDIDNDNDQFGTDSNSKVLVTQTRSTTVAVYDGATQQTLNSLDAVLTYEDGTPVPTTGENAVATKTANKTTGVVSVTVLQSNTAFSHEAINATITAEVTGKGTKKAVFTIRKVMSGQPGITPIIYQLAPTQPTFSFSRDASNNLIPTSRSTQINVAKTEGSTTTILSKAQSGITYKWGFDDSATSTESNKAVGTSIPVTNSDASSHYKVWVELSTGDRETLPIVKDGINGQDGKNGANSIRLALDNEHEDFIYDGTKLVAPSVGASSPIRLYDGGTDITASMPTPEIHTVSGTTKGANGAYISNKTLYVKALTAATCEVVVKCTYNGTTYYAKFTANKTNQDKYDIVCKPSSIAYNSTTYASTAATATIQTVSLSATGIGIGGTPLSPTLSTSTGAGKLCVFWAYVSSNGTVGSFSYSPVTSKTVTKQECENRAGIYFELRYYTSASDYRVCDYETVEIAKTKNGADGTDGTDGKDGKNGNNGKDAAVAVFSRNPIVFQGSSLGSSVNTNSISSVIRVLDGGTEYTPTNINVDSKPSGVTVTASLGQVSVRPSQTGLSEDMLTGSIKLTLTYNSGKKVVGYLTTAVARAGEDASYDFITLHGTCHDGSSSAKGFITVQKDGTKTSMDTLGRGLTFFAVNRETLQIVTSGTLSPSLYDTYGDIAEGYSGACNSLAAKIRSCNNSYFVCLVSHDAVGWNENLVSAIREYGGMTPEKTDVSRYPFVFIGVKGLSQGYALQQQGEYQSTLGAQVTAYVNDSMFSSVKQGHMGRNFYYDGVYDSSKSYKVTRYEAPFVSYNSNYWVRIGDDGTTATGQAPSTTSPYWALMTSTFKYLITEAIFSEYAKLGSWIFNGDYMFSSKDANGRQRGSQSYTGMSDTQKTSGFIPAVAMDATNGRASFSGDKVRFNPNGSGWLANKNIEWNEDGDAEFTGKVTATSGEFTGKIIANSGKIAGDLDVTGGFNVKSGTTEVVEINAGTNSTGSSNGNITILDAKGLYIKRDNEGFRLTTDGFQRWNSTSNSWVNFYGGRYVRTISLYSTATTLYNVSLNDDVIIAKPYVNNAVLNIPSSDNIPEGKILTIINTGGVGIHIRAGSLTIQGAAAYSQVTLNINDRMEFIYSNNKWYANYMPKVDSGS